ncbi:helix-turn-helix domain-containing protein [Paraburkholderia metrosideri]|nr:XRE family transcriptional regulator [Paraburkholderia metrosideri]
MSESAAVDLTHAISSRVKTEREARNWSLSELAERSGVSKAMISKIERGEASPTATVLGRLSGAFGLTLSTLLALAEQTGERLARRSSQAIWQDPETGYIRRRISPPTGGVLELLEIELPVGVRVPYPSDAFVFQHQQIWVTHGVLNFREGRQEYRLETGDCLQLGAPVECEFFNAGAEVCRYVIGLVRR